MREFIVRNLGASDKDVQRYLKLAKRMDYLLEHAKDENDACIPKVLFAEYFILGKRIVCKSKENIPRRGELIDD